MKAHLISVLIALGFSLTISGCRQQTKELPNIILLLADDLGYNDLSFYRNTLGIQSEPAPTCQTPFLDGLADEGIYFTDFYSGAAVCSPSRAALLTGRNKTRLGIYNWIPQGVPMHLESEETTLAELLKQRDYATAHFGKWHLTSANMAQPEPLDQGFDYAFWTHNNAIPSHENPENFIRNRTEVGEIEGYSSHIVVNEAMQWLDGHQEDDHPFYINVWFHEPHQKEAAPDSLKIRHARNSTYYGCIENMDYAVGTLLKYLRDHDLMDNTLILFSSDNGSTYQGSNDPFRGKKAFQYEGGIRVPFIAYWKGKIKPGAKSESLRHFTDVLPTIAAMTGTETSGERMIDGEDFSDILLGSGKEDTRQSPLFFYRYFHDPICMLRQGDMILLGYQNPPKPRQENYDTRQEALFKPGPGEARWAQWNFRESHMEAIKLQEPSYFELYNIREDIGEYFDLAAQQPELLERMKETMIHKRMEMIEEGGDWYEEDNKKISLEDYRDKMKGAWIGQMAGVGWGLPTEFDFIDEVIPAEKVPEWEPGMINQQGNDDLFVEMTFLASMEKYGIDVDMKQAGIDFANTGYGLWAANRTGRENLRSGMAPPESGHPLHNPNCEDIDYQIEADYSGIIAPGMPNVAIRLGEKFGRMMNYGDGVYGGQFVGGMYAAAYFTNDIKEIIGEGLKCIPEESNYAACVRDVLNWHQQYPDDWQKCWEEIMNKYYRTLDHQPYHQQNSEAWVGIDAKVNGAFIVLGLLYGAGDLDQTIVYSMCCGLDSDCNPSNAAGILATSIGFGNLPEKFKTGLDVTKKFSYSEYDFNDLLRISEFFTREFVVREGGKVEEDRQGKTVFYIPNEKPRPSAFVPAYRPGPFDEKNRYDSVEYQRILAYSYKDFEALLADLAPGWKVFHAGKDSQTSLLSFKGKDKVLVLTPMSANRSAYMEYSLESIIVNDEGIEKNAGQYTGGVVSFYLNSEDRHPWSFSLTIRGKERTSISETIDGSRMKEWKRIQVPFEIENGQLPGIRFEIQAHEGALNKAYISEPSVLLK